MYDDHVRATRQRTNNLRDELILGDELPTVYYYTRRTI